MNNKFTGSKKKRREKEYLERKNKRDAERQKIKTLNTALESGDIETMARVIGVRLK